VLGACTYSLVWHAAKTEIEKQQESLLANYAIKKNDEIKMVTKDSR
jgi:hypothetical protein